MPRRVLKVGPKVARDLTGPGRLPDVQNLRGQSPEQMVKTLKRFGIEPDLKAIDLRAQRAFVSLQEMIADGKMPDEASLAKLGEQYEREMAQSLRTMTKSAIRLYRDKQLDESGHELFMWVTSADDDVCPSCEDRHGDIATMDEWDARGKPGSSVLICKRECRCELVPAPSRRK